MPDVKATTLGSWQWTAPRHLDVCADVLFGRIRCTNWYKLFFLFFDVFELRWFKSFERGPHEKSASERLTPSRGTWAPSQGERHEEAPKSLGISQLDKPRWPGMGLRHSSRKSAMTAHRRKFAADPYEVHMRISILTNCKVIVLRWKNILMRATAYWESVVRTTKVAGLLTTALGFVIKSFEFQSSDDSGRQVVYTRGERNWREVDKLVCLWSRTTALKSGWKAFRT